MLRPAHASVLFALLGTALGALYTDPTQLNSTTYDFVVIGGGTAGNVIAARLTENPSTRVLVIEAGVSNTGYDSQVIIVPFFGPEAPVATPFDWNSTTAPQTALNNQSIPYDRGFVLGGGSSTNIMGWTRASEDDYNRWADVIGNDIFAWDNFFPYFLKSETHVPPVDGHDESNEYDPSVHGTSGPILSTLPSYLNDFDQRVQDASDELGGEFAFNLDTNSGKPLGVGWQEASAGHGARSSSATGYLNPAMSRSNLDVLVETRVTKLVRTGTSSDGLPEFKNVEVAKTSSGTRYNFTASKEIVLSAGAIGSPQILLLSGVGDESQLSNFGIEQIVSLPEVGQNLQDHPHVFLQWLVDNSTETFDNLEQDPDALSAALAVYTANTTGPLVNDGGNHMGFFRLPSNSTLLSQYGDPSAGSLSAHYEIAWQNGFVSLSQAIPTSGKYLSAFTLLSSPTSRGYVALNSSDPFVDPIMDPKLLTSDYDLGTMVYGLRRNSFFASANAWDGYITAEYVDQAGIFNSTSDEAIIAYIRKWAQSTKHPSGTVGANKEAGKGVVGSDLTVKNMTGVRVVDASVFPFIPATHLQTSVYALAEAAADIIKGAYSL